MAVPGLPRAAYAVVKARQAARPVASRIDAGGGQLPRAGRGRLAA